MRRPSSPSRRVLLSAVWAICPVCRSAAGGAGAEDREVPDVDGEAPVRGDPCHGLVEHVGWHLLDRAAYPADEMEMVGIVGRVVGRCAVAEVRVRYQTELFEQLERAIDGRQVDAGRRTTDFFGDLVRCRVAE